MAIVISSNSSSNICNSSNSSNCSNCSCSCSCSCIGTGQNELARMLRIVVSASTFVDFNVGIEICNAVCYFKYVYFNAEIQIRDATKVLDVRHLLNV